MSIRPCTSHKCDGCLDRKLGAAARPIIPKRGEKDFEPAPGGGSGLQLHILDRSRDAMFEALRTHRTISRSAESLGSGADRSYII